MQKYDLSEENLVAIMHDRMSINCVAGTNLSGFCSNMIVVGCYSHTVDNAADHFTQPDIQQFLGYSCIRWWSSWEELEQLSTTFPSVLVFLNHCVSEDSCSNIASSLIKIVSEPSFVLPLAALSDLWQIFVTTTDELEGDDFLCILAYDKIMTLLELENN
ncbi:hypothetical protein EMCRGX_G023590 [Ephydatia muelleri]